MDAAAAFLNAPILRGGRAELLQNGDAFYPAMLEAIRGARDTINFEVYIFESDEIGRQFIDAFMERARAGVEVRLLLDWFGSSRLKRADRETLTQAGVKVEMFRPFNLRNLVRIYRRTHRRAIVIDGAVAFTGGAAVSKKWRGERGDAEGVARQHDPGDRPAGGGHPVGLRGELGLLLRRGDRRPAVLPRRADAGPACGLSVVSSPSDAQQPIRLLFWLSFINARRRLWIGSSYFIPDRQLRKAVVDRARAGVDVRILVPGNHTDAIPVQFAGRGYYEELLEAGVRIFEYQPSMMHAKTVVVDDAWTLVGSANMDERSMELNEENMLGIAEETVRPSVVAGHRAGLCRVRRRFGSTSGAGAPGTSGRSSGWRKVLIEQY